MGLFPSLPSGMDKILKEHFDRFMKKHELSRNAQANEPWKEKRELRRHR